MKLKKIIITGPPGTGKSSIIKELKKRGFYCFEEIWEEEYSNPKTDSDLDEINTFSQSIFLKRIAQINKSNCITIKTKKNSIFFDRSIIDVIGYLNAYKKSIPKKWKNIALETKYYKTIFYCPVWENIYKTHKGRKESFAESIMINKHLILTYKKFNYSINNIPKIDIVNRVDYILNRI